MTNILATILVTLVTNQAEVVTKWEHQNGQTEIGCGGDCIFPYSGPSVGPMEKDSVTTVTRITVEKWTFPDGKVLLERETGRELVSESRRHFVKDWKEVAPR